MMRGLLPANQSYDARIRFSPGDAGSATRKASLFAMPTVHPRSCGVCCEVEVLGSGRLGSPPVVRGLRVVPLANLILLGFTPRSCGVCIGAAVSDRKSTVHPRSCGVCQKLVALDGIKEGSPPVVRGLPER